MNVNFSTIDLLFNTWSAIINLFQKYLAGEKRVTKGGKMLINDVIDGMVFNTNVVGERQRWSPLVIQTSILS
jgi:hypothetical protein